MIHLHSAGYFLQYKPALFVGPGCKRMFVAHQGDVINLEQQFYMVSGNGAD